MDALAPGLALGQAIGRWGNWFNQELYGRATDLPWALKISDDPSIGRVGGTYHPTFLYESLWCIGVALLVIWADKRFKLGHGRAFALYVASYCAGRAWIEYMRVDEAHHILGLRLNVWTALIGLVVSVVYIVVSAKKIPGREEVVEPGALEEAADGTRTGKTGAGTKQADAKQAKAGIKTGKADAETTKAAPKAVKGAPKAAGSGKGSGAEGPAKLTKDAGSGSRSGKDS